MFTPANNSIVSLLVNKPILSRLSIADAAADFRTSSSSVSGSGGGGGGRGGGGGGGGRGGGRRGGGKDGGGDGSVHDYYCFARPASSLLLGKCCSELKGWFDDEAELCFTEDKDRSTEWQRCVLENANGTAPSICKCKNKAIRKSVAVWAGVVVAVHVMSFMC